MKKYGIIYLIRNNINGKMYIGQTTSKRGFNGRYGHSGKSIERVYKHHKYLLNNNISGCNKHLLHSIEKYGFDAFEVDEEFDIAYSKEELDKLERLYINIYNLRNRDYGYNDKEGGSHGKHSEKTKKKISDKAKLRTGENHPMYGKHFSEEARRNMSKAQKGHKGTRNGKHCTEEAKEKLRQAHLGKKLTEEHKRKIGEHFKGSKNPASRKVYVYNMEYDLIQVFNTVNECGLWLLENGYITTTSEKPLPTLRTMISRSIKNNKLYGGFILSYEELNKELKKSA